MQKSHHGSLDPQLRRHEQVQGHSNQGSASSKETVFFPPRQLPDRGINDEKLDDAYVAFILYCNPTVPLTTDTSELRETFRSPPKSDGKTFSPFVLFELIQKLDNKDLKTWAQLAIELGVEPPDLGKGQSTQKIQQYAVRLKRWMHAMHVDSFFEYLLGKQHPYWTHIPDPSSRSVETVRDGVPAEEDLALRALLPEMKPKRGRRKADDRDDASDIGQSPAQRQRLHSPSSTDASNPGRSNTPTLPRSGAQATTTTIENLTSAATQQIPTSSNQDRWQQPYTAYPASAYPTSAHPNSMLPQSAILPRGQHPFHFEDEPQSAITSSKSRRRYRNSTVSSAWPLNSGSASGKLRGRPPSNRNVADGPFSTFPASPITQPAPVINLRNSTPIQTPTAQRADPVTPTFPLPPNTDPARNRASRSRLPFLQVPERAGAPIRLATPPLPSSNQAPPPAQPQSHWPGSPAVPASTYEALEQADLARLASATIPSNILNDPSRAAPKYEDRENVETIETTCAHLILSAQWHNIDGQPSQSCSIKEAMLISKQIINDMCDIADTKEMFLLSLCSLVGANALLTPAVDPSTGVREKTATGVKMRRFARNHRTTQFGIKWNMKFGAVEAGYSKVVEISEAALGPEDEDQNEGGAMGSDDNDRERGEGRSFMVSAGNDRSGHASDGKKSDRLVETEKRVVEMGKRLADREKELRDLRAEVMRALLVPR